MTTKKENYLLYKIERSNLTNIDVDCEYNLCRKHLTSIRTQLTAIWLNDSGIFNKSTLFRMCSNENYKPIKLYVGGMPYYAVYFRNVGFIVANKPIVLGYKIYDAMLKLSALIGDVPQCILTETDKRKRYKNTKKVIEFLRELLTNEHHRHSCVFIVDSTVDRPNCKY